MSITTNVAQLGYTPRKVDSTWVPRVTAEQERVMLLVSANHEFEATDLAAYVASGDLSDLDPKVHATLTQYVKQAKNHAPNESQAKRYWPRKMASVILTNLHQDREVPQN